MIPTIYKDKYSGVDKIVTQEPYIHIAPIIGAFEISYKGTVSYSLETILQARYQAMA